MNIGLVCTRYAKSLLMFTQGNQESESIMLCSEQLVKSYSMVPQLFSYLDSPVISRQKKRDLIITASSANSCASFIKFIDLILKNERERFMHQIILSFISMYKANNYIITATLTTAVAIDTNTKERLKSVITTDTKYQVIFNEEINKEVIGGFLLEYNNTRIDATVATQLKKIKNSLLNCDK